ncbi:MAG: branched-chain amino acid ABC transporter permease [Nitratireductor sp.]|nr:branched-chain amino acid ABC transporter permease [Nitratireductor sp.]MCC0020889.1 branched-chain amino acid ABC transporter permease [Nitratireductor sp.]
MDILNAIVLLFNFIIIPALSYGSQLALGALGVTLIYGVLRFSNFAHGETMAFGAMVTILVTWLFQSWGLHLGPLPTALIALPFGILAAVAVVLATDKMVYRYYRRKKSPGIIFLIASIGVMFIMNGMIRVIIGPDDQNFADGERFIFTAGQFREWSGLSEPLVLRSTQAITIILAIVICAALFWFLNRTRSGKAMRAYSDNEDLALLSGIDPDRVVMIAWILAGALATVAGVLYGLDKSFKPFVYMQLLLPIFASAILGGVGNPLGAIAGGYIIAFSEVAITFAYRKFFGYLLPDSMAPDGLVQLLSTDYKFAVSFIILVLVLLIKPTGIFAGKTL